MNGIAVNKGVVLDELYDALAPNPCQRTRRKACSEARQRLEDTGRREPILQCERLRDLRRICAFHEFNDVVRRERVEAAQQRCRICT